MIRSPSFLLALVLLAIPTIRAADSSSDDTLRFAIICDRTGGMRSGVFERAVEKINSLDPEFVMSVGDLIDGYTESPIVWTAQWDELDAIIKNFKAPFHAVVGNHDISNPKMREAWVQRRGATHYAFVRKDVLFLVLDSEDLSGGGFGAGQIAFARNAIAEHANVRWTFVFFHRPLWLQENEGGFDQIADALTARSALRCSVMAVPSMCWSRPLTTSSLLRGKPRGCRTGSLLSCKPRILQHARKPLWAPSHNMPIARRGRVKRE